MQESTKKLVNKAAELILEKRYQKAVNLLLPEIGTKNVEILINLASAYQLLNLPDKSAEYFSKALEVNPNQSYIHPRLWLQKRKMCDWDDLGKLEKTIEKHPHTETPFINMIRVQDQAKNLKIAKIAIQRL